MKTILLRVAMCALFIIGSLSMISMAPPDNTICQDVYERNLEFVEALGISKGQYLSTCNVCINNGESTANIAVCECKIFESFFGDLEDEGFNFGQCVNLVKDILEGAPE